MKIIRDYKRLRSFSVRNRLSLASLPLIGPPKPRTTGALDRSLMPITVAFVLELKRWKSKRALCNVRYVCSTMYPEVAAPSPDLDIN